MAVTKEWIIVSMNVTAFNDICFLTTFGSFLKISVKAVTKGPTISRLSSYSHW